MIDYKRPYYFFDYILRIFFSVLLFLFCFYNDAMAVVTDKSEYWSNEGILVSASADPLNALVLFDLGKTEVSICKTYESQVQGAGSIGLLSVCSITGDFIPAGSYSLIELNGRRANCNDLSYIKCKESVDFLNEALFSTKGLPPLPPPVIVPTHPPTGGRQEVEQSAVTGGGPTAYRPEISIYSPLDGKTYGTNIEIIYEATDKNDSLGQKNLGLGGTPTTIFFSKTADTRQKMQLGTNLPEKGVFKWNTKDLPEGDTYNIIIEAIDKVGEVGESISGSFSIDHTAPVFAIKTDPTITRGEDVKIFVESSKELSIPPRVTVTQNEFNAFNVLMTGSGLKFEGIYKVVRGYDGPAKIDVFGKDFAGNESNLIVSGGPFSVGILPPPKPIILSPLDRDIAPAGVIEVKGKARKDTEVILSLNGDEKFSKKPDSNGEFIFSNLKLRPEFNFGINVISIISKDAAGNISETADINLKYNLAPEIFLESPVKGQILGPVAQISVKATDKNKDKLKLKYEISKDGGVTWIILDVPSDKKNYAWDTTTFEDGDYSMRVTVSDGTSEKVAVVDGLVIKNLLPTFSFADGARTVTNKKELILSGLVTSSIKMSPRSNILSVEYSMNGGISWEHTNIVSGLNTAEVKFNISLNFTEEKIYQLLLRAKDDRDIYGRGIKTVVVIFEPPTIPTIISNKNGDIVDDLLDGNKLEAGVQIGIEGKSKPNTTIIVKIDENIFSGKVESSGRFLVTGVTIRKHGNNYLEIYAEDEAGNKSGINGLNLIYNNAPSSNFLNPRHGRGLNHKTTIEFTVSDPDGDDIKTTNLSLKKPGESYFTSLDINSPNNKFEIDVSSFEEGAGYEIRLEATDGISKSSKTVVFFVDNTKPKIYLNNVPKKNFKKDFKFEATGYAEDSLSGIEFVEYSLDGTHWFKALITKGFLTKKSNFKIRHPFTLDDGEYEIKFRAVDVAGNYSDVWLENIVVDTMPPRMGSFEILYNNILIYPDENGFSVLPGKKLKIRASFEADTEEAYLLVGKEKISLLQTTDHLWTGDFERNNIGSFEIKFGAKDQFNNIVENKKIGNLNIIQEGVVRVIPDKDEIEAEIVDGADIGVYMFNEDGQRFERWPGEYYGIENPTKSDKNGKYSLFLPSGKYQIRVHKVGFVKLKTNEFSISSGKFLNFDFELKRREGVRGFIEDVLEKIMIF
ncbi:MAG: hypothetical protein UT05_C0008G0036 [Parcubacteria group bacterium GW2011_GWF2_38_76]|nr:MAG: hypothetical protein UT05_C0008G0036 [Parcubacteria group bacterium GW2011_GWF2_38_76]HBM45707.1 hypothetical protein [Patescibacteria group bacterium]